MTIRITKDGRQIWEGEHWQAFRTLVYNQQDGYCRRCGKEMTMSGMHVHHVGKRGMGGSKRDDRGWWEGGTCEGLCVSCHQKEHA